MPCRVPCEYDVETITELQRAPCVRTGAAPVRHVPWRRCCPHCPTDRPVQADAPQRLSHASQPALGPTGGARRRIHAARPSAGGRAGGRARACAGRPLLSLRYEPAPPMPVEHADSESWWERMSKPPIAKPRRKEPSHRPFGRWVTHGLPPVPLRLGACTVAFPRAGQCLASCDAKSLQRPHRVAPACRTPWLATTVGRVGVRGDRSQPCVCVGTPSPSWLATDPSGRAVHSHPSRHHGDARRSPTLARCMHAATHSSPRTRGSGSTSRWRESCARACRAGRSTGVLLQLCGSAVCACAHACAPCRRRRAP